ncbi:MAG: hypothetical protein AB7O24_21435 [Kofleriaceae bacterium]
MELTGLEARRNDLARGIVIARSGKPLDASAQRALWEVLAAAGVTELEDSSERDDESDATERQWLAAPWLPPTAAELEAQRAALERVGADYGLDAIWCVMVQTGIDGIAWLDMISDQDDIAEVTEVGEAEASGAIPREQAQVLYAAPDAPEPLESQTEETFEDDDENDEDGDDDEQDDEDEDIGDDEDDDEDVELEVTEVSESHWRQGPPPYAHSVTFPIERYPEIIEDYDRDSFGVALKLAGDAMSGEESVVNAFFALWLSVYQDERTEDFEPFQRADVVHDRRHRSALMRVDGLAVPATANDQVHFLLWIVAQIHEILPLAWARFAAVADSVKTHTTPDSGIDPFVLAGNPLAERFRRLGEEAALAWASSQSGWSRRELAEMLIEVALHEPVSAEVAERLLRRAQSYDASSDATDWLGTVLIQQNKIGEAIAIARAAPSHEIRLLVVGETAEHAPTELASTLVLLDPPTLAKAAPDEIAELVVTISHHAPSNLEEVLQRLPKTVALVPYLYNASFSVERPQGLAILRKVLSLPVPPRDGGEARTAFVMAWNNACIHAHALGEFKLAEELAMGGQPYGPENPYIYHSAACAYAAVGKIDQGIEQVSQALEHEYEHSEKMETDGDLEPLQSDPRFSALFVEWRTHRADLN